MAIELELKTVIPDPAAVRAALQDAGATSGFRGMMRDRRLDRDSDLERRDEVLRLRTWAPAGGGAERAEVAWKGPATVSAGYKHREELEFDALPGAAALALLEALGYRVVHAIDRYVEVHEHAGTTVRLEWYPRMDVLAEIEGAPAGIERTIAALGLAREGCTPEALTSFAERYARRTGRPAILDEAGLAGEVPTWRSA